MRSDGRPKLRVTRRVHELRTPPDFAGALAALRARPGLVALDSAGGTPARWSLIAFDPLRGAPPPSRLGDLAAWIATVEDAGGDEPPIPFGGGFVGALSYDLGVAGEERHLALPRDPWSLPSIVGGLYCDYLAFDHAAGKVFLVLGEGLLDGRAGLAERRAALLAELGSAAEASSRLDRLRSTGAVERRTGPAEHRARIAETRRRIARGDFYQANLAHRFECRVGGDPLELYLRLRRVNAAPYAGFLAWSDDTAAQDGAQRSGAILSSSPELLLDYDGAEARTRPIKGTIARGRDAAEDAARRAELMASAKDRAELAMIVDLERNDLGRLAQTGSVRVEGYPRLESYAAVHHLAADVAARMGPGTRGETILAALFPGGSVTGAPKVAAMRAIAELEREGRGYFTGSLGWVGWDGRATANILIRTLVWRPRAEGGDPRAGEVCFHVGGGITWSSDEACEDDETLHKARALLLALEGGA